jgi:GNAT superfamily N-acetyltransferase
MSAYRFCRTDDIALLVDALNRCWAPYFPDEPPMTPAAFKRSIRDLQVWCSSCMVAFSAAAPIGVLIGAKRPTGTLVHKLAVHPDHRRQGHGRHLLASLGSKLGILGPPRIMAEVPETFAPARNLFGASGYAEEAVLTDYVRDRQHDRRDHGGHLVIPITVDDLAANGLLENAAGHTCWERSVETLTARKDEIAGLAVASEERIEASILYIAGAARLEEKTATGQPAGRPTAEIVSLRSFVEDDGARLNHLLSRLGFGTVRFPKAHPAEIRVASLEGLGFRPAGRHVLYATTARAG